MSRMVNKMNKMKILILALVLIANMVGVFAVELSELGESCKLSADCRIGYCGEGICRFPTVLSDYSIVGNCTITADCLDGFCTGEYCILPKREEYGVLSLGLKSGCAGIIENCVGIWCLFCNVTWILLVIGAGLATFIAMGAKRKGRILPILMFLLPVLFGIFILPSAGVLVSIIEIFVLAVTKKGKAKRR